MSVEQVQAAIEGLPPDERVRLAQWFDDHRHELVSAEIASAQQREVLSRLAEMEKDPGALQPFEEAHLDKMVEEFRRARAQKTPSRQS